MKRNFGSISLVWALGCGTLVACTGPSPNVSSAVEGSSTTSAVTLRGTVDQALINPRGELDGILLRDGTIVRVAPGSVSANALSPNQEIDVSGVRVGTGESPTLERATISHGGVALSSDPTPPPPPRPGADAALSPITDSATVRRLLRNPEGIADGLLLNDGATVRVPPTSGLDALGLKPGDRISVAGHGTASAVGKGIRAEQLTLSSGKVVAVDTPPIPPVPSARDGSVERLLLNPHGDVDVVLLTDGTVIRIPPTSSAVASSLPRGTGIHVEGASEGAVMHATTVRLSGGAVVASEPAEPPPAPPAPDEGLTRIEASGTIVKIFVAPRGETDEILLGDGTVVKLPKRLADSMPTSTLAVGSQVRVEGAGGRYALGTALRADALHLSSGQTFVEPLPPGRAGPGSGPRPLPPSISPRTAPAP